MIKTDLKQGLFAYAILFLLVTGFYTIVINPALSKKAANNDRIESLLFQANKLSRSESEIIHLKKEIKTLKLKSPNKENFLANNPPAIVAADLQNKIKQLVSTNGGNLMSTHALPGKNDAVRQNVIIKVQMRSDIDAMLDVFYQLAINKPLLFTDNIIIQKQGGRRNQQNNEMIIRFDVSGYIDESGKIAS